MRGFGRLFLYQGILVAFYCLLLKAGQMFMDRFYFLVSPDLTGIASLLNWPTLLFLFVSCLIWSAGYVVFTLVMDRILFSCRQGEAAGGWDSLIFILKHRKELFSIRIAPSLFLTAVFTVIGIGSLGLIILYPQQDTLILPVAGGVLVILLFSGFVKSAPRLFRFFRTLSGGTALPERDLPVFPVLAGMMRPALIVGGIAAGGISGVNLAVKLMLFLHYDPADTVLFSLIGLLTLFKYAFIGFGFLHFRFTLSRTMLDLLMPETPSPAGGGGEGDRRTRLRRIFPPLATGTFLFLIFWQSIADDLRKSLQPLPGSFEIVAHRGDSLSGLENTPEAVMGAAGAGVDMVELDLQYTADSRIIVFHDETLARMTGADVTVGDNSYKELARYPLPDGRPVTLLEEVLDRAGPSVRLNLEVKNYGPGREFEFMRDLVAMVREKDMTDRVLITSLDYGVLRIVHAISDIPTGMIFLLFEGDIDYYRCDYVILLDWGLDSQVIREMHERGKKVYAWSIERESDMESLYLLGADGVITDNIRRGMDEVRKLSVLSPGELQYERYRRLYI